MDNAHIQENLVLPWEQTLPSFLDINIQNNPNKIFLEINEQQISYSSFGISSKKSAEHFLEIGISKGDRVCLFLDNCPEFLFAWFGLARIGAIGVPINTSYKEHEFTFIVNNCAAKAVIYSESFGSVIDQSRHKTLSVQHFLSVHGNKDSKKLSDRFDPESRELQNTQFCSEVTPNTISTLVYTSGTTGDPKGVQITHKMYVAAGQGFAYWTESTNEDRFFTCLPFFHANAQYYSTMGAIASGATLIVEQRFSASKFWEQVRDSKATVVNFIGMMMSILAKNEPTTRDTDNSVRLFYGSPAFSPEFLSDFQKRFDTDIIVGFGMTETCYGTIEVIGEKRRANSSGKPRIHPDRRFENLIRILDEQGKPVPNGTPGEISLYNPAIMPGYWNNPEQSKISLHDGWLHTGDLGWVDEDDFLYFVDRKKDIIRRRGENISSKEVEDVIKQHLTVLECAIIAVPAEFAEDEVKAYLIPKPGSNIDPKEIILWCASQLAYFKVPRYIEIRSELPQTPSLRIRKDILRNEKPNLVEDCFDREAAGINIR
ncbi:MAG: AMP-binding protein [Dehalococcoidia bacterium]|tara:strand:- start:13895 stop:15520 length:1626 start_codon:yes stop_codon:yes gene_type:complete